MKRIKNLILIIKEYIFEKGGPFHKDEPIEVDPPVKPKEEEK